jgi:hypothetical protein
VNEEDIVSPDQIKTTTEPVDVGDTEIKWEWEWEYTDVWGIYFC